MPSAFRLGLASVALAALAACDEPATPDTAAPPRPVRAIQVGTTEQIGQRSFSGRAQAARQVALAFRVPGRVLELPVIVGDDVEQGHVVARLDPAPYLATVNRARAELAAAKAAYANASAQYARVVQLVKKGTFSRAQGDEAKADNDTAAATVTAMQAALEAAELDLQYAVLEAPFPGRIVATYFEKFEEVRAQEPVLRLLDISRVEMEIEMPETLISLIPLVEEVKVVFDAFPDHEVIATVKEVGAEASTATRTFPVTLIMDQPPDVAVLPGMAGRASAHKVRREAAQQSIIVPVGALVDADAGPDRASVWVVDAQANTVSRRPVTIGGMANHGILIQSGLEAGEWVVTAGANSLVEGQQVRLPGG
jgi:RND family efflux transporter MFP subunit